MLSAGPLEEILNWTKAHLDACLATAEVILEQSQASTQDDSCIPLRLRSSGVGCGEVDGITIA